MLVVSQELRSDPHVAELRHEEPEAFTREIELMTTPTLLFKEDRAVHVDEYDEQTEREVRDSLIYFVNLLDLVVQELEDFLIRSALRHQPRGRLLRVSNRERLNFPPLLHSHHQLYLAFEGEAHRKALVRPRPHLQLEIELL